MKLKTSFFAALICLLTLSAFAQQSLYWTEHGSGKIMRGSTDGTVVEPVLNRNIPEDILHHNGELYWSDSGTGTIRKSAYDGTNEQILLANLDTPKGIDISPSDNKLYWAEYDAGTLNRSNLDGSNPEMLSDQAFSIIDIALDLDNDLIYYLNSNSLGTYNLSTNTFTTLTNVGDPKDVALHLAEGKVYWTSYADVNRANLDGTEAEEVPIEHSFPKGFYLDTVNLKFYYCNSTWNDIFVQNLDGTGHADIFDEYITSPSCLTVDAANDKIFYTDLAFRFFMNSGNLDGSNQTNIIKSDIFQPSASGVDEANGDIYWINASTSLVIDDSQSIYKSDGQGENRTNLIDFQDLYRPYALDLDAENGYLYYADLGNISRTNLDGSNTIDLATGTSFAYGIVLNKSNNRVYWTDRGGDLIQSASASGGSVQTHISTGLDTPLSIAIDESAGKMYWVDSGTKTLSRANLDGSAIEVLFTELSTNGGIAIDSEAGVLYFANSSEDKIEMANLDGSNRQDVITSGVYAPSDLKLVNLSLTAIQDMVSLETGYHLFPNPVKDYLQMNIEAHEGNWFISNAIGQQVLEGRFLQGHAQLNLTSLQAGIYYITFRNQQGKVFTQKFIKQ